jgi:hypothetical protein
MPPFCEKFNDPPYTIFLPQHLLLPYPVPMTPNSYLPTNGIKTGQMNFIEPDFILPLHKTGPSP